mmetsp:Transcript_98870/g.280004  ORF Transcript_98870/g.280004 Transcript_98870/m.280004 type:complete len:235 (+) Transcript_98870:510-1214(+)
MVKAGVHLELGLVGKLPVGHAPGIEGPHQHAAVEEGLAGALVKLRVRRDVHLQRAVHAVEADALRRARLVQREAEGRAGLVERPELAVWREADGRVGVAGLVIEHSSQFILVLVEEHDLREARFAVEFANAREPLFTPALFKLIPGRLQEVAVIHGRAIGKPDGMNHAVAIEDVSAFPRRPDGGVRPHAHVSAPQVRGHATGFHRQLHVPGRLDGQHAAVHGSRPPKRRLHLLE